MKTKNIAQKDSLNSKKKLSVSVSAADCDEVSQLFKKLGMDMTTAINLFLKQSIAEQRLPFRPQLVDSTTKAVYEVRTGQGQHFESEAAWQESVKNGL